MHDAVGVCAGGLLQMIDRLCTANEPFVPAMPSHWAEADGQFDGPHDLGLPSGQHSEAKQCLGQSEQFLNISGRTRRWRAVEAMMRWHRLATTIATARGLWRRAALRRMRRRPRCLWGVCRVGAARPRLASSCSIARIVHVDMLQAARCWCGTWPHTPCYHSDCRCAGGRAGGGCTRARVCACARLRPRGCAHRRRVGRVLRGWQ